MIFTNVSNTTTVDVFDEHDFVDVYYSTSQQHCSTGLKTARTSARPENDTTEYSTEDDDSTVSTFDLEEYELSSTGFSLYPKVEFKRASTTTKHVWFSTVSIREYNIEDNTDKKLFSNAKRTKQHTYHKEKCLDVNEFELFRKPAKKSVRSTTQRRRCYSPPPTKSEHNNKVDKTPTIPKRTQ